MRPLVMKLQIVLLLMYVVVLLLHLDQLCGTASPNTSETQHLSVDTFRRYLKTYFLLDINIQATS